MALIETSNTAIQGPLSRLAATVADVKGRIARYRMYRTTLAELQSLSERELADLGLSRSMLRRAAYQAAYD